MFSRVVCAAILLILLVTSPSAQRRAPGPVTHDAVQAIAGALRQHPVVIIGEAHWLRQAGDFYIRLVHDPVFQGAVQDIVIEFASRNNQPLLDRYIEGKNVPIEDVRRIWRDTTKVASWESPIYAEWLASIREVNQTLPRTRRIRVLAGDTPVDWSRINTHNDWEALGDNNVSIAGVIQNQVLAKKLRALVVLGSNHVTKSGDRAGADNVTTLVESLYPGSTYVVLLVGAFDRGSEDQLHLPDRGIPALYDLAGTPLAQVTDQNGSTLIKKADGLLYLGPRETLRMALPPAGSLEPAYLKEVDRRSMIEWGEMRARTFLGPAGQ